MTLWHKLRENLKCFIKSNPDFTVELIYIFIFLLKSCFIAFIYIILHCKNDLVDTHFLL